VVCVAPEVAFDVMSSGHGSRYRDHAAAGGVAALWLPNTPFGGQTELHGPSRWRLLKATALGLGPTAERFRRPPINPFPVAGVPARHTGAKKA